MPQFARPVSEITAGGWVSSPSGQLWETLDESIASDTDYDQSPTSPVNARMEVGLGPLTDPLSSSGHVFRYRYQKDVSGGSQINLTVELRQGAAVIASASHTNIPNTWTAGSITLSGAQADAITNYNDLRASFSANQV